MRLEVGQDGRAHETKAPQLARPHQEPAALRSCHALPLPDANVGSCWALAAHCGRSDGSRQEGSRMKGEKSAKEACMTNIRTRCMAMHP